MNPFDRRSAYMTCAQVAAREGVSRQCIARLCRLDAIFPVMKHGRVWLIAHDYAIAARAIKSGDRTTAQYIKAKRGRPKGSKNKNPYPEGVKRPRKKSQPGGAGNQ